MHFLPTFERKPYLSTAHSPAFAHLLMAKWIGRAVKAVGIKELNCWSLLVKASQSHCHKNHPLPRRRFCSPCTQVLAQALPLAAALTAMTSANSLWINSFIFLRLRLEQSPSSFAYWWKTLLMMEMLSKKRDIFLQIQASLQKKEQT